MSGQFPCFEKSRALTLRWEGLPTRFGSKRNQHKSDGERQSSHRHWNSERTEALNAISNKECDGGAPEPRKRSAEGEGTRAAFRGVLFRQPEGVDRKVGAAEAEKEKAYKKPRQRGSAKIENFAEGERDEDHHQREVETHGAATSKPLREPRHCQTSQNCCKGYKHRPPRGKLRGLVSSAARGFRKRSYSGRNIDGSRPQPRYRGQHEAGIENRAPAQCG